METKNQTQTERKLENTQQQLNVKDIGNNTFEIICKPAFNLPQYIAFSDNCEMSEKDVLTYLFQGMAKDLEDSVDKAKKKLEAGN